jgi:hypothetical protein
MAGLFGLFALTQAGSQDRELELIPRNPYAGAEVFIPGGQQYGTQGSFSTSSTTLVGVPSPVTINNATGRTQRVLIRWSGNLFHQSVGGWAVIAPMVDGVALPTTPGPWFVGVDAEGDAVESSDFGVQWMVEIGAGVHTFQPAIASSNGGSRLLSGYHFTAEMKTK